MRIRQLDQEVNTNNILRRIFFSVISGIGLGIGFYIVNKVAKRKIR